MGDDALRGLGDGVNPTMGLVRNESASGGPQGPAHPGSSDIHPP